MEATLVYTSLSICLLILVLNLSSSRRRKLNLPPSPLFKLPVIGHLYLLKPPLYRTFADLSTQYGPVFSLQLGTRLVVAVSSPSAAEESFTKNDIVFANRPRLMINKYLGYNNTTVSDSPYGDHWRNLRRLCALEIFSTNRLNNFQPIRRHEINLLVHRVYQTSGGNFGTPVDLKSKLFQMSYNIIMRMIAGKRYFGEEEDNEEANHFQEIIDEIALFGATSNPVDFMPAIFLCFFRSMEKDLARLGQKIDTFLQGLIDEHRHDRSRNTMIDHLLSLQESEPEYYTDQIIKGIISVSLISSLLASLAL